MSDPAERAPDGRGDTAIRRLSRSEPVARLLAADGRGWPLSSDREWVAAIELGVRFRLLAAIRCEGVACGALQPLSAAARTAIEARLPPRSVVPELVLERAYEDNRERMRRQLAAWGTLDRRLRSVGIDAVPLKGLHTVLDGWWTDPAARAMTDLDLLVVADQAPAADQILDELGYIATAANDWSDHHLPQRWLTGSDVCVEMHTSLSTVRTAELLPAAEVLTAAAGGRLTSTHAVVHLIAHAQLQHEGHRLGRYDLARLYDFAALYRSGRFAEVDWELVRARFAAAGAEAALDRWLLAARALYGVPLTGMPVCVADLLTAAIAGLRLEGTMLGRAQLYALKAPQRLSAKRMRALYGPGRVWRHRLLHLLTHRPGLR